MMKPSVTSCSVIIAMCMLPFMRSVNATDLAQDVCYSTIATQIECQDKSLTGYIPEAFSNLSPNLITYKVYKNAVSGTLPTEVGTMTNLKSLVTYRNEDMSGWIPSQVGMLYALTEMNVYKNKHSGTIAEEWGGFGATTYGSSDTKWIDWNNFVLMNNKFSGCIPESITVCSDALPNNSQNGYCSLSTQGAPGLSGNCATGTPTSAPTEPSYCTIENLKRNEFDGFVRGRACGNKKFHFSLRNVINQFFTTAAEPICDDNRWVWTTTKCKHRTKSGKVMVGRAVIKATRLVVDNPGTHDRTPFRRTFKTRCFLKKFKKAAAVDMCPV